MPKYAYKARNAQGRTIQGEINASSKPNAKNILANKGLRVLKLTTTSNKVTMAGQRTGLNKYFYKDKHGRIQIQVKEQLPSTKELALFTKQFSMMIENGIPMLQALQLIKEQQKKQDFADIIDRVSKEIEEGST